MTAVPTDVAAHMAVAGTLAPSSASAARRRQPGLSTRRLICAGTAAALVVWLLLSPPDLTRLTMPHITSWWWIGVAALAVAASFWAAALVLQAMSPIRVSGRLATATQVGAAATKLVAPASAGVVGLNARLLARHGAPLPAAVAAVAGTQVAQLVVTLGALVALVPLAQLPLPVAVSGTAAVRVAAGTTVLAMAIAVVLRRSERVARMKRHVRDAVQPVVAALASPRRALTVLVGSLGLTAALATCLWASLRAVGAEANLAAVAVVLLVGSALGSALPTPGGLGGVEGAMVAGLVAAGVGAGAALPAVLLFRLLSFWAPMPLGAVALVWLRRRGSL
ncbi:MAG TPA: YbhN family protein [Actinomycetales bacterium]|nr:YbhN family protein [Actinomycetales bacterium]